MDSFPKKITFVIESLGGGGAQHVASTLANKWVDDGIDISVVTFLNEVTDVYQLDRRITRIVIGGGVESKGLLDAICLNFKRIYSLRAAIKSTAPDIVISFVSTMNILTVIACLGQKIKTIISERNDPARQNIGRAWSEMRKLTYGFADIVTANSKSALKAMQGYVPQRKLVWLPNPIKSQSGSESVDIPKQTILSAGRLHSQKAFDILLEGFSSFSKLNPEWHLIILGEGPLKSKLLRQSERLGIEQKVSFPGFTNPFPYYKMAQIFILPSHFEGLPNVVLEAMNHALPVVVTDQQTGLQGVVENEKNGLVIKSNSPEQIEISLTKLANDRVLREKLGQAGQSTVLEFNEEKVMKLWDEIIQR